VSKLRLSVALLSAGAGTVILLAGVSLGILSFVTSSYQFGWIESLAYTVIGSAIVLTSLFFLKDKVWACLALCGYYTGAMVFIVIQAVTLSDKSASSAFQLFLLCFAVVGCMLIVLYLISQYRVLRSNE
jgi:hypothetical protein